MLVVGAGLLVRSFRNLTTVDAGFDARNARHVRRRACRRRRTRTRNAARRSSTDLLREAERHSRRERRER